jgi:hypothetical protein
MVVINRETLTNTLISSNLFSRNIFPKNLCEPIGIPIEATDMKMTAIEIKEEEMPITSGVVIFDKIYQYA